MALNSITVNMSAPEKRHQIADYIKIGNAYVLMGLGFSSINESYGAQEDGKAYVNDSEQSSTVTSYQREFSYNCDLIKSEVAVMALLEVGKRGLTGTDAMFEYVRIDLYLPKTSEASNKQFYARYFVVSCIPDSEEGDGAEIVTSSGSLKPYGGMKEGWFDVSTKTFTEDSTAYATAYTVNSASSASSASSGSSDSTADTGGQS